MRERVYVCSCGGRPPPLLTHPSMKTWPLSLSLSSRLEVLKILGQSSVRAAMVAYSIGNIVSSLTVAIPVTMVALLGSAPSLSTVVFLLTMVKMLSIVSVYLLLNAFIGSFDIIVSLRRLQVVAQM